MLRRLRGGVGVVRPFLQPPNLATRAAPRILLSARRSREPLHPEHLRRDRLEASAFPPEFLQRLHHRREYSRVDDVAFDARAGQVEDAKRRARVEPIRGGDATESRVSRHVELEQWQRFVRVDGERPSRELAPVEGEGCKSRVSRDVVGRERIPEWIFAEVDVGDDGGGAPPRLRGNLSQTLPA